MKIETIVAGVDFEGSGLAAARWAAKFLGPDRLILVSAVHVPGSTRLFSGLVGDQSELVASARLGTEARLAEFAAGLQDDTGVAIEWRVRIGSPADQVQAEVEAVDADLVVIGPHASRRGRWSLLGSTAVQLLHDARVPTLVGRGSLQGPPARVMGAVDEDSTDVPAWTRHLCESTGARPGLLHVIEVPLEAHLRAIEPPRESRPGVVDEELASKVEEWLAEVADRSGLPDDTERHVSMGEPSFEILAAADRYAVDLIVMGTRASGVMTRALMGSIADAVLRRASCPVLAVPNREEVGE
jgi:nucleotide-binding universal stress UspA family protein